MLRAEGNINLAKSLKSGLGEVWTIAVFKPRI